MIQHSLVECISNHTLRNQNIVLLGTRGCEQRTNTCNPLSTTQILHHKPKARTCSRIGRCQIRLRHCTRGWGSRAGTARYSMWSSQGLLDALVVHKHTSMYRDSTSCCDQIRLVKCTLRKSYTRNYMCWSPKNGDHHSYARRRHIHRLEYRILWIHRRSVTTRIYTGSLSWHLRASSRWTSLLGRRSGRLWWSLCMAEARHQSR